MKRNYSLLERVFGPRITQDEILNLEFRALDEGWHEWLQYEIATAKSNRKLHWLLAGLRDGYITVTVVEYADSEAYTDDDPYQND